MTNWHIRIHCSYLQGNRKFAAKIQIKLVAKYKIFTAIIKMNNGLHLLLKQKLIDGNPPSTVPKTTVSRVLFMIIYTLSISNLLLSRKLHFSIHFIYCKYQKFWNINKLILPYIFAQKIKFFHTYTKLM